VNEFGIVEGDCIKVEFAPKSKRPQNKKEKKVKEPEIVKLLYRVEGYKDGEKKLIEIQKNSKIKQVKT
jgi:hypothetical protein